MGAAQKNVEVISLESLDMARELLRVIIDSAESQVHKVGNGEELTVGLELEFFLVGKDGGSLATLTESTRFFEAVGKQPGWQLSTDSASGELPVSGASRELGKGRYTKLKYEYAPHIVELALPYYDNAVDLSREFEVCWEDLARAAGQTGIVLSAVPFANVDAATRRPPVTQKIADLNESRRRYLSQFMPHPPPSLYLFPAYTAGTQIHIGGTRWWQNPAVIGKLYEYEATAPLFGASLIEQGIGDAVQVLTMRDQLYRSCFPGVALIGIPPMEEWTLLGWALGLLAAPLSYAAGPQLFGRSYLDLAPSERPDLRTILPSLRDLQYVRPRFFGTIEFRADPCLPTPKAISALAAWRLALSVLALTSLKAPLKLSRVATMWEARRLDPTSVNDSLTQNLVEDARAALASRGFGEESLLFSCVSSCVS